METFQALKRRTTDLIQSLPQSLPAMPSLVPSTTHTLKGTWEKISVPPLPRSSHSVDVVNGTAYIFGGEIDPRQPVDNDMHAIILPFSSAPADYYAIKAKAARPDTASRSPTPPLAKAKDLTDVPLSPAPDADKGKQAEQLGTAVLGDVPAARVGHATAVIGHRIFLFGGRGGPDMKALDEGGRVWVFDTRRRLWSYLDPDNPLPANSPIAGRTVTVPPPRSYHAAAATDKPSDFSGSSSGSGSTGGDIKPQQRTWQEWVSGDMDEMGTPQRPVVGVIAERATDAEATGYGTFIVHGGCLTDGGRAADTWAFDVHTRVWRRLPDAPGAPRGGTALAVASGGRLFRFGGFNGETEEGGQLDMLQLAVETFDDQVSAGEVSLAARGGWQSVTPAHRLSPGEGRDYAKESLTQGQDASDDADVEPWPGHRSVAGLEAVTLGGREYLVLMLGERDPSGAGHAAAGKFWDDIWAFRVPPSAVSAISLADRALSAVGRKTGDGRWARLHMGPHDEEDDASADGPGPRGWIATSRVGEIEESAIFLWGGLNDANQRLGDGWIFRFL